MDERYDKLRKQGADYAYSIDPFVAKIFSNVPWCYKLPKEQKEHEEILSDVSVEKLQIFSSLEGYVKENIQPTGPAKIDVVSSHKSLSEIAGEVFFKEGKEDKIDDEITPIQMSEEVLFDSLYEESKRRTDEALANNRFGVGVAEYDKLLSPQVKILFVTDTMNPSDDEVVFSDFQVAEVSTVLDIEAAHLFVKMINAMKLSPKDYLMSAIHYKEESILDLVEKEIAFFKPFFVITLGASASKAMLSTKEKLSAIQGRFFTRAIQMNKHKTHTFQVVPLFHPEFLLINPNMKKTTWKSMQKIMNFL